eukprot:SAG11_NODE_1342_length_5154_cov_2.272404_3_plen_74_part_00
MVELGAIGAAAGAGGRCLLLACDGVWDVFTAEEAAAVCLAWAGDPQHAAEALCDAALAAGSRDNVSVIVVNGI